MKLLTSRFGAVVLAATFLWAPATFARADNSDWPMFGHDPLGTRFNSAEKRLSPTNVSGLKVLWKFTTPAIVAGNPAVVGGVVFDGDAAGNFYALQAQNGALIWKTTIPGAAFTASPTVTRGRVVIGSQSDGVIYGLDRDTGAVVWQTKPNTFGRPAIWGSGTIVGHNVAIGVASNDEGPPPPFVSRGSMVLLNPEDGRVIWETFMISDAEAALGASGGSIWSTPAFDEESNTIFAGTGNNFTQPSTITSDAIIAFDATTGAIKWVNQRTPNDVWTPRFPTGPDFDFGDSPVVYRLSDGRKVVGDGQKSGFFHVLDAATGQVVNFQQFLTGSIAGGFYSNTGTVSGMLFAPGNNLTVTPPRCALIAMTGDASKEIWRFETTGLEANGIAIANGVVFFKPSSDPNLYAFDLAGGKLAAVSVGGSNSGLAVAHGRVFLGLGNVFAGGFRKPGGIAALGLPRDAADEKAD